MNDVEKWGLALFILGVIAVLLLHIYHLKGAAIAQAMKQDTLDVIHESHVELLKFLAMLGIKGQQASAATLTNSGITPADPGTKIEIKAIPIPPAPRTTDTVNGVAVPTGVTTKQFTSLVVAIQGVAAMLSNADLNTALLSSSQAWWESLGDYFREMLLLKSEGALRDKFLTLSQAQTPPALMLTTETLAAGRQAAGITK